MPSKVELQVELVEKNAEARLRALDKLAKEMGNRKITLNFDEASLAKWKAATDKMTNAQLAAFAKVAVAQVNAENKAAAQVVAAAEAAEAKVRMAKEKTAQADIAATGKALAAEEAARAKKVESANKAEAKEQAAKEKTAQVEMQLNAKLAIDRQKSFDKKFELQVKEETKRQQISAQTAQAEINANAKAAAAFEKEETKRQQISAQTAQAEINANAKAAAAAQRGTTATKNQTTAQKELNTEAEKTDKVFSGLTSRFAAANLISSLITAAISKIKQAIRQAVDEMKEMEKELTTIKMVTGASDSDISALREKAFQGARETGRTTSDYLSAAERFARAGYRQNIEDLTKLSLVTQNVGGVTEDVASKFILAADAAWKMGGSTERLWSMLDGVTAIADQNATDIGKIAEAYTVAGSAFANAGESERTFAALIGTTTAATQRSGSELARGLQTILFRVRQVKGELDDGEMIEAEDISNAAKALDSVGISVLNDSKELKSFSEIMGELNVKWDTLDSKQKAYMQNALAGNRRGNVLFALMDNWDEYQRQLKEFDEASGTALEKNETYLDSWEAKTNDLNTAWTNLVSTITDSGGALQLIVEGVTKLVDKTNEIIGPFARALKYISENKDKLKEALGVDGLPGVQFETRFGRLIRFMGKAIDWMIPDKVADTVDAQNDLSEATIKVIKSYENEADAVDELSNAFTKAEDAMKAASDAMKKDKDDAVKSAKDIFKAMSEAESKGYFGSNAYKEGAKLFFGTTDKKAIKEESKKALETYFEGIKEGDYSNAAATLWGSISDENGEIVDASGEVIASLKDMGDSYKWTFDKTNQGAEQFLKSMQESTGISAEFWASLISSLGMYSDQMDSWMEEHAETEMTYKVTADTDQAKTAIDQIQALLDEIKDKNVKVTITTAINGATANAAYAATYATYAGQRQTEYYRSRGYAGGKRDSYSGIALVNDEFPADGSKPELIISKSTGRAFIANGGRPAFVNLRPDDIVLSAKETRSAMGVPTFAHGTATSWTTDPMAVLSAMIGVLEGDSVTTPKEDGEEESKKKKKKKPDADKAWTELKKLIEYLLDKANDDLKEQLQILDAMLEEMENSRKAAQEAKKLEEKQTAAQEALLDLERAQTERTVRYYNEQTQQWEWMADQGSVQQAQEAYNEALDSLKEYEDDLAYEARKAEIEAQKDALQEQYDAMKDSWAAIVDAIEAPAGDLQQLLNTLSQYGTSTMISQSGGIADLLNKLRDGLFGSGYGLGLGNINANTNGSTTTTSTVFDDGGFAYGAGMMRKGAGAETVIGPGLTRAILNPVKNERFSSFVDSLRCLVDGGNGAYSFGNRSSITNNNGGNYYVNGVRVGSDMAQRPFAEVMQTIAIHANESL